MSKRIKGITIEIGGDTTGLDKALSGVEKSLSKTQTSLRDVNKLLKLDPTNTTLLQQKYELLQDGIEKTKEKLAALKEADKLAKTQLANGELGKDKYDALQLEIVETENALKNLETQAKNSQTAVVKIAQAGEKVKKTGQTMTNAGKKMLPVTAGITAVGTAAVKTAADFESSMSQVQATMGISSDAMSNVNNQTVNTMDALSDLAKEMGSKTAFSASECAEALNYLALAGYDTQQMTDALPTVLNLAAAGGLDLASASDMVTDAMSALGMETSQADTMVDQMAKTASSTNTSVAQLGEGMLTIGATAKTMKSGTAELSTALGILANNGIKGAEGGTHLRNVILALQNPTDKAKECMKALGIQVYDSEGNMRSMNDILGDMNTSMEGMTSEEKANIIAKIFNKTDIAAVNTLLDNTGSSWDSLQTSITDSAGAAQKMADTQLDNMNGQLTILKSAVESLAISLGELLLPCVKTIIEWVQSFVNWLNSLDEGTKKTIVTIGLVLAAVGPVLIIVGKLITAVGTIISIIPKLVTAFRAVKTAFAVLSAALSANPFVAVVMVIGTLIAALVSLYQNCEWFRDGVNNILQKVGEGFLWLGEKIAGALETAGEFMSNAGQKIGDAASRMADNVKNNWEKMKQNVSNITQKIGNTAISAFNKIGSGIASAGNSIYNGAKAAFSGAVNYIKNLKNSAVSWGKDMMEGFKNGITGAYEKVKNAAKSVASSISSLLHFSRPDEGPLRDYDKWMPDFMDGLAKGINDNAYKVTDAVSALASKMSISPNLNLYSEPAKQNISVSSPDVSVMIGNKEFKGYIVETAKKGIASDMNNYNRGRGVYA